MVKLLWGNNNIGQAILYYKNGSLSINKLKMFLFCISARIYSELYTVHVLFWWLWEKKRENSSRTPVCWQIKWSKSSFKHNFYTITSLIPKCPQLKKLPHSAPLCPQMSTLSKAPHPSRPRWPSLSETSLHRSTVNLRPFTWPNPRAAVRRRPQLQALLSNTTEPTVARWKGWDKSDLSIILHSILSIVLLRKFKVLLITVTVALDT